MNLRAQYGAYLLVFQIQIQICWSSKSKSKSFGPSEVSFQENLEIHFF